LWFFSVLPEKPSMAASFHTFSSSFRIAGLLICNVSRFAAVKTSLSNPRKERREDMCVYVTVRFESNELMNKSTIN
jgi:hypothetical protein